MITVSPGSAPDLKIIVASGVLTRADLQSAALDLMRGRPARAALWDFTGGDGSALSTQDLVAVFDAALPYTGIRGGMKTAMLFESTLGFGLGRLCEALAEVRGFPCELKAFLSREDAMLWLRMSSDGANGNEGVA